MLQKLQNLCRFPVCLLECLKMIAEYRRDSRWAPKRFKWPKKRYPDLVWDNLQSRKSQL